METLILVLKNLVLKFILYLLLVHIRVLEKRLIKFIGGRNLDTVHVHRSGGTPEGDHEKGVGAEKAHGESPQSETDDQKSEIVRNRGIRK